MLKTNLKEKKPPFLSLPDRHDAPTLELFQTARRFPTHRATMKGSIIRVTRWLTIFT